jgi:hypothetical protein
MAVGNAGQGVQMRRPRRFRVAPGAIRRDLRLSPLRHPSAMIMEVLQ